MNFYPSRWLLVLALGAAVSAPAQQTTLASKPMDAPADTANAFMGNPQHQIHAGDYRAPSQLFNDFTPDLPMPAAPRWSRPDASAQDALNRRKNWTLLTPEQILGIQTPEQILGVPDPTGESKLPLEQQYLLREDRLAAAIATNGRAGSATLLRDDDSLADPPNGTQNPFSRRPFSQVEEKPQPGAPRTFSQLWDVGTDANKNISGDGEKMASAWTSVFAQPNQPKQSLAQQAEMERFEALMEPSSPPDKIQAPAHFSTAPEPAVDPFLQPQPVFNPAGHSVAPLEDNVGRPTGIQPLSGVTGPVPTTPKTRPAWEAQLPPWLQSGPQPHSLSQGY